MNERRSGIGKFLLGENKTVFRAGYSIAYERFTQVLFDQLWGYSAPGLLQQNTFSPPSYLNLSGASLPLVPTGPAAHHRADQRQQLQHADHSLHR